MHVFYTPDIANTQELPEEEAGHCLRVLRLGVGDEVMLTDGRGFFYQAVIAAATQKRCMVKIVSKQNRNLFGVDICIWHWPLPKTWIGWSGWQRKLLKSDLMSLRF